MVWVGQQTLMFRAERCSSGRGKLASLVPPPKKASVDVTITANQNSDVVSVQISNADKAVDKPTGGRVAVVVS